MGRHFGAAAIAEAGLHARAGTRRELNDAPRPACVSPHGQPMMSASFWLLLPGCSIGNLPGTGRYREMLAAPLGGVICCNFKRSAGNGFHLLVHFPRKSCAV